MTDPNYAKEILKTGYVLENAVAVSLREAGWTVISNKYYEDDLAGSVREIDLLAYKVSKVQGIDVYTTLLISCKKSSKNAWALLARRINLSDPNADWWPVHAWSNDKSLSFEIARPEFAKTYRDRLNRVGVSNILTNPEYEVFAFQEMDRNELGVLPSRKKNPCVYQFNLLSVVDADLVRLVMTDGEITQEAIESEHYISRYIIKKRETFSRIRFVTHSHFRKILPDYDHLHKVNCGWMIDSIDRFYEDILSDWPRVRVLLEDFRDRAFWPLYTTVTKDFGEKLNKEMISLGWNENENCAIVELPFNSDQLLALNDDNDVKAAIGSVLQKVYRYSGDFKFSVDLPF